MEEFEYEHVEYGMVTIEYEYEPEEAMIHTYSNGDPGHPGSAAHADIHRIWVALKDRNGKEIEVDVSVLIDEGEWDHFVDQIIEYHED